MAPPAAFPSRRTHSSDSVTRADLLHVLCLHENAGCDSLPGSDFFMDVQGWRGCRKALGCRGKIMENNQQILKPFNPHISRVNGFLF
jgi:hypothetical protein